MVKLTNQQVADIIDAFVDGTGADWDWDDFCSLEIENQALDAIRLRCCSLPLIHPPQSADRYCNQAGIDLLREVARDLRKSAL